MVKTICTTTFTNKDKFTGRQMCEHIVKAGILKDEKVTAKQIWDNSPNGELYHVIELFKIACDKIGKPCA